MDRLHIVDPILGEKIAGGGVFVTFPSVTPRAAERADSHERPERIIAAAAMHRAAKNSWIPAARSSRSATDAVDSCGRRRLDFQPDLAGFPSAVVASASSSSVHPAHDRPERRPAGRRPASRRNCHAHRHSAYPLRSTGTACSSTARSLFPSERTVIRIIPMSAMRCPTAGNIAT